MSERHDIDKLVKEGLKQPPPFSYKEENWEQAAHMLDEAAGAGASGMRRWVGLGLLLLIGLGGSGLVYYLSRHSGDEIKGMAARQHVLALANPEIGSVSTYNYANYQKGSQQSERTQTGEELLAETNNKNQNLDEHEENKARADRSEAKLKQKQQVTQSLTKNESEGARQESENGQPGTRAVQKNTNAMQLANTGSQQSNEITSEAVDESRASKDALKENEGPAQGYGPATGVGNQVGISSSSISSTPNKSSSIQALSWFTLENRGIGEIMEGEVLLPPIHPDYDVAEALAERNKLPKWSFWVDLGLRLTKTWDASSSLSANPMLGVGVGYRLSPRLQVTGGLYGARRSNESVTRKYTVRQFSFGVEYRHYGQVLNHVYYATVPLSLDYLLHPRHQVGIGGQLNYVVTTYSTATSDWPAEIMANEDDFTGYSYLDGINRLNGGLNVHYTYFLNDLWSVWLQFDYALGASLVPDYYFTDNPGYNHGLGLGLRHYLK